MDPISCPFHLREHVWPFSASEPPCLVTPQELEDTKKYLNQVQNNKGYDVDCTPHPILFPWIFFERSTYEISNTIKGALGSTIIDYIELKPNTGPSKLFFKKHPSAGTAEEMLTIASDIFSEFGLFSMDLDKTLMSKYQKLKVYLTEEQKKNFQLSTGQDKLKEEVEKWKSKACSLSIDKEASLKGVRTCTESYLKRQDGVTPKNLSPLDPSTFPLQHVEAEPLQTLPPAIEENQGESSGSSVHVKKTSPNLEAEDIPSPLI